MVKEYTLLFLNYKLKYIGKVMWHIYIGFQLIDEKESRFLDHVDGCVDACFISHIRCNNQFLDCLHWWQNIAWIKTSC